MKALAKYYRGITVACAFLLLFVNVGFNSTAFSVYQHYLVDLPGVGDIGGATIVTVRTLVSLVCMFFTGFYFRHLNPRIGFGVATFCSCVAFVCYGTFHGMAGLCFSAVLSGIGYGLGGMVASTYLIGNWFSGKVGHVAGIAAMGSGVAAIVVPICAGWVIETFSLTAAFYSEAVAAFIISLLLLIFVRMTPYEVGLKSTSDAGDFHLIPTKKKRAARKQAAEQSGAGNRNGVDLPFSGYAIMVVAIILLGGISVAGYNYFGILLTSQGIEPVTAAALISVAGIFLTISKFLVGAACDRFGTLAGSCIFFVLLLLALVLCSLIGTGGVPEAAFAAMMLGIGMPLGTTGISLWSLELTTPEKMLKTIKRFQISYAFGGFAFNMMPGILSQLTGTYTSAYEVLSVMSVVCAILVIAVYRKYARGAKAV